MMPREKLKMPRSEAENVVIIQIEKGKGLLRAYGLSSEGIADAERRYLKWDEDNLVRLTEMFDSSDVADEYTEIRGFGLKGTDDISRVQELSWRVQNKMQWLESFKIRLQLYEDTVEIMDVSNIRMPKDSRKGRIFIGHGRAHAWRDLKDFLRERLSLEYEEFNREPIAGKSNKERLLEMLSNANFAFLVMTAEDEHADKSRHARENVVHEAGLFQGRLGFEKAIILLEEGCSEFSNVTGVGQIRFPKGNIKASFEEIRRVLEREEVI